MTLKTIFNLCKMLFKNRNELVFSVYSGALTGQPQQKFEVNCVFHRRILLEKQLSSKGIHDCIITELYEL